MRILASPPSIAMVFSFATGALCAQVVLPTNPHAMTGIAGINTVGSTMTVATNANRSIVNWQTFSIGSGATVSIQQPGATSANLNRVVGAGGAIDPSVILGTLQSNGRVFLLNPSGIVFGAGAQIDVAGLVASSLNLSNADFLGGRLNFTAVPGAGAVVNQGTINTASGGQVYLVGPAVTNSGVITSPQGEVILAAGNSVELVDPGTPNLRVEITAPDNEAKNLGNIVAQSGRIGIYAGLITSTGTLNADRAVTGPAGEILLKATTTVSIEGTMSANEGSISIEGLSGIFLGNGASITANSAALTGTACPTSGLACGTISPLPPPPIVVISNPGGDISLVGQQGGSISVNPGATGTVSIGQGGGSLVLTNSGSLTLVAGSGAITTTTVQGPLTLQSINLLSQLPAGQAASRGNAQIMGSMSTISRVNDFTRGLGSAAPQTLAPPRTALTFE